MLIHISEVQTKTNAIGSGKGNKRKRKVADSEADVFAPLTGNDPEQEVPEQDEPEKGEPDEGIPNPKKRKVYQPYRHEGHTYHVNAFHGETVYLECAEYVVYILVLMPIRSHKFTTTIFISRKRSELQCPARMIRKVDENNQYVHTFKKEHNHMVDPRDVEVTKTKEKLKRSAKDSDETTRSLVAKSLDGVSNESLAQMPGYKSLAEMVRRQRKDKHLNAPANLMELEIPQEMAQTTDGEPFVLYDSGPDEKNRLIILGTEQNLDVLATCDVLYMDGTFDSCPQLFSQLYIIHGN